MAVSVEQIAALRTLLADHFDEHRKIIARIGKAGAWNGYHELITAAFSDAVHRRFSQSYSLTGVVEFVADVRTRFGDAGREILSRPLIVLEDAGFIKMEGHHGCRPRTWVRVTRQGRAVLAAEIAALTELLRLQQLPIPSARAHRWPRTASISEPGRPATTRRPVPDTRSLPRSTSFRWLGVSYGRSCRASQSHGGKRAGHLRARPRAQSPRAGGPRRAT